MMEQDRSRRAFIRQYACAGAGLLVGGMFISGCDAKQKQDEASKNNSCVELSEVSAEEIKKRENLGYVEESPIAENQCSNCNLYLPPTKEKNCSGCVLFQGPVNAEAYCTYWAPKV